MSFFDLLDLSSHRRAGVECFSKPAILQITSGGIESSTGQTSHREGFAPRVRRKETDRRRWVHVYVFKAMTPGLLEHVTKQPRGYSLE